MTVLRIRVSMLPVALICSKISVVFVSLGGREKLATKVSEVATNIGRILYIMQLNPKVEYIVKKISQVKRAFTLHMITSVLTDYSN